MLSPPPVKIRSKMFNSLGSVSLVFEYDTNLKEVMHFADTISVRFSIINLISLYLYIVSTAPQTLEFSIHNYMEKSEATVHL